MHYYNTPIGWIFFERHTVILHCSGTGSDSSFTETECTQVTRLGKDLVLTLCGITGGIMLEEGGSQDSELRPFTCYFPQYSRCSRQASSVPCWIDGNIIWKFLWCSACRNFSPFCFYPRTKSAPFWISGIHIVLFFKSGWWVKTPKCNMLPLPPNSGYKSGIQVAAVLGFPV